MKNFQIIEEGDRNFLNFSILVEIAIIADTIYLMFGRVDKDDFIMDFQWPFSPY